MPKPNYWGYYSLLFWGLWGFWHGYTGYKRDLRAEKYGVAYNRIRERLEVPVIPADWHIEFKGDRAVEWLAPKGAPGHESKYIVLDSTYKMDYERDEYNFKGIHDTSRNISILYEYATRKSKDSIFYTYITKDTSIKISRHQADSIFEMAKIRRDY